MWNFDLVLHQLDLVNTKVLENRRQAICTHFELTAFAMPAGIPNQPPCAKFVTCYQLQHSLEGASFLQFWTYSFRTKDLFLDQAIEFDCPLSQLLGDPAHSEHVILQMQRDQTELIIFNPDGTLRDKVDQS